MKRTGLTAVAIAAVMTLACGGGARNDANDTTATTTVGTAGEGGAVGGDMTTRAGRDGEVREWVNDAAMHGTAEVELGKIAAERGSSAEVKQFGEMMVRDHTKANEELMAAVKGQVELHPAMDEEHQDLAEKLRGLSGMEFDREYMDAMVDGHEQVKEMLEEKARDIGHGNTVGTAGTANDTAAGNTSQVDMAVSQWAAKTLPAVSGHLEKARQIREHLNDRNSTR